MVLGRTGDSAASLHLRLPFWRREVVGSSGYRPCVYSPSYLGVVSGRRLETAAMSSLCRNKCSPSFPRPGVVLRGCVGEVVELGSSSSSAGLWRPPSPASGSSSPAAGRHGGFCAGVKMNKADVNNKERGRHRRQVQGPWEKGGGAGVLLRRCRTETAAPRSRARGDEPRPTRHRGEDLAFRRGTPSARKASYRDGDALDLVVVAFRFGGLKQLLRRRWRFTTGDGEFDAKDLRDLVVISCFPRILCVVVLRLVSSLDMSRCFLRVYVLYSPCCL